MIVFNIGGISHNEIASLNNLVKDGRIGFKLVIGSTGIYNADEYIKDLISMNDEKKLIGDNNRESSVSKVIEPKDIELQVYKE